MEKIGDFNQRCKIMQPTTSSNALGEETITWAVNSVVYCRVEYPRAQSDERFIGDQQTVVQRVTFVMRNRYDIVPKWKINYRDEDYDILVIRRMENNKYMAVETEYRK